MTTETLRQIPLSSPAIQLFSDKHLFITRNNLHISHKQKLVAICDLTSYNMNKTNTGVQQLTQPRKFLDNKSI